MRLWGDPIFIWSFAFTLSEEKCSETHKSPTQVNKRYAYVDVFMNKTNKSTLSIYVGFHQTWLIQRLALKSCKGKIFSYMLCFLKQRPQNLTMCWVDKLLPAGPGRAREAECSRCTGGRQLIAPSMLTSHGSHEGCKPAGPEWGGQPQMWRAALPGSPATLGKLVTDQGWGQAQLSLPPNFLGSRA